MSHRNRWVLVPGVTIALTGCMSWSNQKAGPAAVIVQNQPKWARVIRHDSSVVVLFRPTVVNDSIRGVSSGREQAVSIPDISKVALYKWDWTRFGFVMGLLAGFVVLAGVNSGCC